MRFFPRFGKNALGTKKKIDFTDDPMDTDLAGHVVGEAGGGAFHLARDAAAVGSDSA